MTQTIFLQKFGTSPLMKVLYFIVVNEEFDYSMTDIAELSGVGYSTLKLFWNKLENNGIVVLTRSVGKAKIYSLNLSNPSMKLFKDFYWKITKQKVHEQIIEKAV